jgi:hypothetical protein
MYTKIIEPICPKKGRRQKKMFGQEKEIQRLVRQENYHRAMASACEMERLAREDKDNSRDQ